MLLDFESSDEQVVLLNIATDRGQLHGVFDQISVDFNVSLDFERTPVSECQHVHQRGHALETFKF